MKTVEFVPTLSASPPERIPLDSLISTDASPWFLRLLLQEEGVRMKTVKFIKPDDTDEIEAIGTEDLATIRDVGLTERLERRFGAEDYAYYLGDVDLKPYAVPEVAIEDGAYVLFFRKVKK